MYLHTSLAWRLEDQESMAGSKARSQHRQTGMILVWPSPPQVKQSNAVYFKHWDPQLLNCDPSLSSWLKREFLQKQSRGHISVFMFHQFSSCWSPYQSPHWLKNKPSLHTWAEEQCIPLTQSQLLCLSLEKPMVQTLTSFSLHTFTYYACIPSPILHSFTYSK